MSIDSCLNNVTQNDAWCFSNRIAEWRTAWDTISFWVLWIIRRCWVAGMVVCAPTSRSCARQENVVCVFHWIFPRLPSVQFQWNDGIFVHSWHSSGIRFGKSSRRYLASTDSTDSTDSTPTEWNWTESGQPKNRFGIQAIFPKFRCLTQPTDWDKCILQTKHRQRIGWLALKPNGLNGWTKQKPQH